ncbi:MAG: hypothetical protein Q7J68_01795 [Thermoplasmata archaeon]|nr:hypothetical protein [Thermoplasmata archaeon]
MKVTASKEQVASILNDYKSETHTDPETGELQFGGLPIIFARAEIMSSIYQELESLVGESASAVLKRMGRSYGEKFHALISEEQEELLKDRKTSLEFVCAETQAIGWGNIMIDDEDDKITISSKDGLASGRTMTNRGKSHAVDSYFVGYFEGLLSKLDNIDYYGEESECVAKGDAQCKLVFTRKQNL